MVTVGLALYTTSAVYYTKVVATPALPKLLCSINCTGQGFLKRLNWQWLRVYTNMVSPH